MHNGDNGLLCNNVLQYPGLLPQCLNFLIPLTRIRLKNVYAIAVEFFLTLAAYRITEILSAQCLDYRFLIYNLDNCKLLWRWETLFFVMISKFNDLIVFTTLSSHLGGMGIQAIQKNIQFKTVCVFINEV